MMFARTVVDLFRRLGYRIGCGLILAIVAWSAFSLVGPARASEAFDIRDALRTVFIFVVTMGYGYAAGRESAAP